MTLAVALAFAQPARAGVCDNGREAWITVGQGLDALSRGRGAAALRAVSPLTAASCTPSGRHAGLITQARLEARLMALQVHALPVAQALGRPPRMPASVRTGAAAEAWVRTSLGRFVATQRDALRRLEPEADAVATDARAAGAPAIQAEANAVTAALYARLAAAVQASAPSPSVAASGEIARAFGAAVDATARPLLDAAREALARAQAAGQSERLLPRDARLAQAWLTLNNVTVAPASTSVATSIPVTSPNAPTVDPAVAASGTVMAETPSITLDGSVAASAATTARVRAQVEQTIAANLERLRACLEPARRLNPELRGRMVARMVVGPGGMILQTDVTASDPATVPLRLCVRSALAGLRFPPAVAGATISYPFLFDGL